MTCDFRSNTAPTLGIPQPGAGGGPAGNKDDLESKMANAAITTGKRKTTKVMDRFRQLLSQPKLLASQKLLPEDADFEAAINDYEEIYDFQVSKRIH